jgi:4-amino-4-deoxy-L-arabinose transferase-like glycosyltransferase
LALVGVVSVGAVAFLWRLGYSSLFIDETYSWHAAAGSFGGVFSRVRATEVAPPGYYVLLHFWIGIVGSNSEWAMRFLSVVAGIAFVAGVWWLGRLLAGDAVGLLAGLMAALSPVVVQYAQEIRAYIFVMLFTVVAVAAAIRATRGGDHASRWVGVAAAASVAAIWVHYTGLLVIVPLAVYVWTDRRLSVRVRRAYVIICGVAFVIVAPLMVMQLRAGHQGGVAPFAHPSAANFARVVGTPFDGNFAPRALAYAPGAAAVLIALAYVLAAPRAVPSRRDRWLLIAAAGTPVAAVIAVTVAAAALNEHTYYSLITRYTAVAAAFMLISIAIAIVKAPRPAGGLLGIAVAIPIVAGLAATYSSSNAQPNLRAAFNRVASDFRPGDQLVLVGTSAQRSDAAYYVARLRRRFHHAPVIRDTQTPSVMPSSGTRLWIVSDTGSQPAVATALAHGGRRTDSITGFNPTIELTLASR